MIFRFDVGMELRGGSGLRAPVRVMRLQALRLGWRSILRFAVIQRSKEAGKRPSTLGWSGWQPFRRLTVCPTRY